MLPLMIAKDIIMSNIDENEDIKENVVYASVKTPLPSPKPKKMAELIEELPIVSTFAKWLHEFAKTGDLCQLANLLAKLRKANPKLVRRLIEHGDELDNNRTPLLQAANIGKLGIVQLLVDKYDAHLLARDQRRESTALHLASANGHLNVTAFLIKVAPKLLELTDANHDTALNLAAANGHFKTVEFLATLEKRSANKLLLENRGRKGRTAFLGAVSNGHLPVVELLAKFGADFHAKDDENKTALGLAASRGHLPICQFLLEKGFSQTVDEKSGSDGKTPLQLASQNGHLGTVAFLLRVGANSKLRSNDRSASMAIHLAAESGHLNIVRYFLQAEPDLIEALNGDANSPLSLSCLAGHEAIVNFLVTERGANIENRDRRRSTPILQAKMRGHERVVHFLERRGDKVNASREIILPPTHSAPTKPVKIQA